jgi:hypothetical protein
MSVPLDLPVLIYISKPGCPACMAFETQWKAVISQLNKRARLVKFQCSSLTEIPPPLRIYTNVYPTVILAGPKSYFRVFTPDDQPNEVDYNESYVIKAEKFNAVKTESGYQQGGRPYTASTVIDWFNLVAPTVPNYDEPTPPSRYVQEFKA